MMIEFILLAYRNDKTDVVLQSKMLQITTRRIKTIYPETTIHLLTNASDIDGDFRVHYRPNLRTGFDAKFEAFDIADKPMVFMDTDVLLSRPFSPEELECTGPFRLYSVSSTSIDMGRQIHGGTLLKPPVVLWNSGVVLIPRRAPKLLQRLREIHEYVAWERRWNDEYAFSYLVAELDLEFKVSNQINVARRSLDAYVVRDPCVLGRFQSIHYTGGDYKDKFLKEHKLTLPAEPPML
jgi:hypothetical protein